VEKNQKAMLCAALDEFGRCDITVGGESMRPFICDGDRASIVRPLRRPRYGDVAAFFKNDQLIVHRVVGWKRPANDCRLVIVRGDSSCHSTGTIGPDEIIGIVSHVERNGKKRSLWFRFPLRLLAIPVGLLLQTILSFKNRFFK
jgi:hypothetical protein